MAKTKKSSKVFSALEVANICGVVNQTAINWIKNGWLKAFSTPGGQYRVEPEELIAFMKAKKMRIPPELLSNFDKKTFPSVLIVDDDKGLNTVIARFLASKFADRKIEIFQAFDGFEAGVIMSEKKPSVLILDIDLPGVDGISLCKRSADEPSFSNPLIIVVTALEDEELEKKVKELGAAYFLNKPLSLSEISEALEKAYSQ